MKKNFLFLDVETTGLNEHKQDIIQLACFPVILSTYKLEHHSTRSFKHSWNYNRSIKDISRTKRNVR